MGDIWLGVLPVAGMGAATCLLFLLSAVVRKGRTMGLLASTAVLLLGGGPVLLLWNEGGRTVQGALLSSDRMALFFDGVFVLAALFVILLSMDYIRGKGGEKAEIHPLIVLSATGMMVLASATILVTFYLGLETMSIAFYVLAGTLREHNRSVEAALKYFLTGAFSSAFLLFGMALLYGSGGSLDFGGLAIMFKSGSYGLGEPFLVAGLQLFLVGLFFKLSLIPFHFWAPDVYQGSPTPISALMAVGGKAAAAAGAIRIFLSVFSVNALLSGKWLTLFMLIGLITIFAGSMIAITQRKMKRLLAYSSIVHAGFLALGIGALAVPAVRTAVLQALLFYLAAYLFMNVGAFALAGAMERKENTDEDVAAFSGLGTSAPFLAALFALFMFSLAGIPLTVGFIGKFYLFKALIMGHLYWYAALGLIGAVIATFYYLKVTVALYFPPQGVDTAKKPKVGALTMAVLTLTAAATLYFGLFPGLINSVIAATGLTIG